MRVVAGEFKGRRLHTPRGSRTRPTADRVREALFSMLGDVSGARVLDLYAGSGALGIEALSRGAKSALFVERDRQALAALRRNLEAVGADADVRREDARSFLARAEGKFDLVFVSDGLVMDPGDHPSFLCRFEPTSLISALSLTTSHIGLGADPVMNL